MTWTPPKPKKYFGIDDEPDFTYYTLAQLEAVRREAIEECAKLVEAKGESYNGYYITADAIRKLLEQT